MEILLITTKYWDYQAFAMAEGLGLVVPEYYGGDGRLNIIDCAADKPDSKFNRDTEAFWMESAHIIVLTSGAGVPKVPGIEKYGHKLVLVDGADLSLHELERFPHALYFKREKLQGSTDISFPLCAHRRSWDREIVPWEDRDIDVLCAFHASNPMRPPIMEVMKQAAKNFRVVLAGIPPETRLHPDDYAAKLSHAKIAISPRGFGQDAYNFWEIPAFGTAMVAQERSIIIDDNFVGPVEDIDPQWPKPLEAVFFREPDWALHWVDGLMAAPEQCRKIAERGRAKLLKYHTSEARAKKLLDLAEKAIYGGGGSA